MFDGAGRLLLHKRVDNGLWGFIGGSMRWGETFEQTAWRGLWEEAGFEAGALRLLGVLFPALEARGEPRADPSEGLGLRCSAPHALPDLSPFEKAAPPRVRERLLQVRCST